MATEIRYVEPADLKVVREKKRVVVDREIERIYHAHGETLQIDDVIEEAKKPKSPLHPYFDWDDSTAAAKWRRTQALHLIMQSKIVAQVIENGQKNLPTAKASATPVRRLVNAFRGEGFKMRAEALSDDERRKAIVARKLSVLRSWVAGTVDIIELTTIRQGIVGLLPPAE